MDRLQIAQDGFRNPGSSSGTSPENNGYPLRSDQPPFVRALSSFVSYVFHPLFIPAYVMAFLLFVHPYAFAGFEYRLKVLRFLSVVVSTALLPAFSVFLLWRLEFIQTIFLRTQRERIIPYAIALIFYFWVWYVFKNLSDSPPVAKEFLLGVFLAVCFAWMANIAYKVSMHSTAVGGMLMFILIQSFTDPTVGGTYVSIALLITGLVCTARLALGGHTRWDVYSGLLIGAAAQLIALWFN
ncbi:MAG TPA: hypothetical protein VGD17_07355 [Chitinophagaceae bacterium]